MSALTAAMRRELRSIERTGNPTDPDEWHGAGGLWFAARKRVIGALLKRGLIEDGPFSFNFSITEKGRAVLTPNPGGERPGNQERWRMASASSPLEPPNDQI